MTAILTVAGIDPGPATGFCIAEYTSGAGEWVFRDRLLFQADGSSAVRVLRGLLAAYYNHPRDAGLRYAGIEKFVTGRSAGTKGKDADLTRQLVMELAEATEEAGFRTVIRAAAEVKPWASDRRLAASGITGAAGVHGKLRDSYDAARHMIYAATWDAGVKDPLIRRTT